MILDDAVAAARLGVALPGLLRHPFTPGAARAALAQRLREREALFLALVRAAVFERPSSPYRPLLRAAGCEFGDLAASVARLGLEGALRELLRNGVYLTLEEWKGRRPLRRGCVVLDVTPEALRNPRVAGHLSVRSSQSRGESPPVPVDLAFVRDHAIDTHATLEAIGGRDWDHAHWGIPGGGALVNLLEFAAGGRPALRWFSQLDPGAGGLHPRYAWSGHFVRGIAALARCPFPAPQHVSLDDPLPIVLWMAETLRAGRTPHLWTYASSAVRVCQRAHDAGIRLEGAQFTMGGEPSTEARLAVVRRAGATPWPRYGSTETDIVAFACARPQAADDMHLLHDRHAVVHADVALPGLPAKALFFSSLLASDPLVLLNVSLGDQAELAARSCGCPLEALGLATHIAQVRSFEKLTAAGMSFLDLDVIRVLEEVLPARFGGGPTHYQLLEEEDAAGAPRLRLLVDPCLGPLDLGKVQEALFHAIGPGSGVERAMALAWKDADLLRVDRAVPLTTRSGKILHLHRPAPPAA